MDYNDLNKACPKDAYPLPIIYRLVDGANDHSILCFLDAYSNYYHILVVESDMLKIVFITKEANYYKVMSCGLKNVRATYQRLMDKVFGHLIGASVEIYVDDMVVISPTPIQHS